MPSKSDESGYGAVSMTYDDRQRLAKEYVYLLIVDLNLGRVPCANAQTKIF